MSLPYKVAMDYQERTHYDYRFGGIHRLYGKSQSLQLKEAHVLVVGLGGVGSWVVEALARTGVGELTLMDFDDICITNTNRQIHAITGNVGHLKTQALRQRVTKINPDCKVNLLEDAYSLDKNDLVFSKKYTVVVDAIDTSLIKFHLVKTCKQHNISVVVVGSAGGRKDPTQIKVADLSKSREDNLLSILRKDLRRKANFARKGSMGVSCVFSMEKPVYPLGEDCISNSKPEDFKKPLDCATGFGTATHITGTFGFMASYQAIELIFKSNNL